MEIPLPAKRRDVLDDATTIRQVKTPVILSRARVRLFVGRRDARVVGEGTR